MKTAKYLVVQTLPDGRKREHGMHPLREAIALSYRLPWAISLMRVTE